MSQMPGQFPPAGGGAMAPPPKKSNTVLWVVLGIGGLFLCCCGGGIVASIGGLAAFGGPLIAFGQEVAKLPLNATVQEKLGTNIRVDNEGEPVMGADRWVMKTRITGDKGSAKGTVEIVKAAEGWKTQTHKIEFADGSTLDVVTNQLSGGAGAAVPGDIGPGDTDAEPVDDSAGADSETEATP